MRPSPVAAAIALAGLAIAGALIAGPLDPPAGPVTPTYKTLSEVEPRTAITAANTPGDPDSIFKITQPGSYYLIGNIAGAPGKHGIEVAASGVTLDLGGYQLMGVPGSLDGIEGSASAYLAVRNGKVLGWDGNGVTAGGQSRMADLVISANANGIAANVGAIISGCSSTNNIGAGFNLAERSVISLCTASGNGGHGFVTLPNTSVTECVASGNSAGGFLATASNLSGCVASTNGGPGLSVQGRSFVNRCTAAGNSTHGILVQGSANRIDGNSVVENVGSGIAVSDTGNTTVRNSARGNTNGNYNIVPGNDTGPIGPAATATNPWANIQY